MDTVARLCSIRINHIIPALSCHKPGVSYEVEYWNPAGDGFEGEYILNKWVDDSKISQFACRDISEFCDRLEKFYIESLVSRNKISA